MFQKILSFLVSIPVHFFHKSKRAATIITYFELVVYLIHIFSTPKAQDVLFYWYGALLFSRKSLC